MIGGFVKTDVQAWGGRDCCRLLFRGTDVRSPYIGRPDMWDDDGPTVPVENVLSYMAGRKTLEGAVLTGEPLRDPEAASVLSKIKKLRIPARIETYGTRPDALDDVAGALLAKDVLITLAASPFSDSFPKAMPGADPKAVIRTLEMTSGLDISSEVEIYAIPGAVAPEDISDIAGCVGKNTVLTIRQFRPETAPDPEARKIKPYKRADASALRAAATGFTRKVALKGFRLHLVKSSTRAFATALSPREPSLPHTSRPSSSANFFTADTVLESVDIIPTECPHSV